MCVFLSAYLVDFMRAGDRWKGEGLVISLNHLVYTPLGTEHRGGELWLGVRGTEIRTPVATESGARWSIWLGAGQARSIGAASSSRSAQSILDWVVRADPEEGRRDDGMTTLLASLGLSRRRELACAGPLKGSCWLSITMHRSLHPTRVAWRTFGICDRTFVGSATSSTAERSENSIGRRSAALGGVGTSELGERRRGCPFAGPTA